MFGTGLDRGKHILTSLFHWHSTTFLQSFFLRNDWQVRLLTGCFGSVEDLLLLLLLEDFLLVCSLVDLELPDLEDFEASTRSASDRNTKRQTIMTSFWHTLDVQMKTAVLTLPPLT
jgi:hypothetical protein